MFKKWSFYIFNSKQTNKTPAVQVSAENERVPLQPINDVPRLRLHRPLLKVVLIGKVPVQVEVQPVPPAANRRPVSLAAFYCFISTAVLFTCLCESMFQIANFTILLQ